MLLRGQAIPVVLRLKPPALRSRQPHVTGRGAARLCTEAGAQPGCRDEGEMEKKPEQQPSKPAGNVMADSFGEGYSTRSDEEGFGGVYRGNPTAGEVHENHHGDQISEFDRSQGSEAAEKEKGRNQPPAPAATK